MLLVSHQNTDFEVKCTINPMANHVAKACDKCYCETKKKSQRCWVALSVGEPRQS